MLNLFLVSHSSDVLIMAGWNSTSWEDKVDNPEFENLEKSRKSARQGRSGR
jgi:hypothetical protein